MTDMIYNLRLRLRREGNGAGEAAQAVNRVGQAAQATGNRVRQTLRWQNGAWQEVRRNTSAAGDAVKQLGGTLDRTATQGRRATDQLKRGLQDDAREVRAAGTEVDRFGRGLDRLRLVALRSVTGLRGAFGVMRREFDQLHRVLGGVGGRLATLGIGVGAAQALRSSAQRDRTNIQLRQTADMSPAEMTDWRRQMWAMARANGNDPDAIQRGMGQLVAAGLNYRQALPAARAADIASTISGADQGELGDYQVTAAGIFGEDLAKPGVSNRLLAQGLVGGRLGRAELPNLPNIFPRVGGSAQQAGLNYAQTIGYIEALSNIESQPERLATLAESTLRMFTNARYRQQVTQATGVSFYNRDRSRRDPYAVLTDLRRRYQGLRSDARRDAFMNAVIGEADLDTQRGFRSLLQPGRIEQARDYGAQISRVTDFDPTQLEENRQSATATAGRVRATVGEALDKAAQPVNKALANAAQYLLDDKGLTGGQLLGGAAMLGVGGYYGGRLARWTGNKALNGLTNLLGGSTDTIKNIVVGHALQESTGVVPVFVTNWSGNGGGGTPGTNKTEAGKAEREGASWGAKAAPWLMRLGGPVAALSLTGAEGSSARDARALLGAASAGDADAARQLATMQLSHWWNRTPSEADIDRRAQELMGTPEQQATVRGLNATPNAQDAGRAAGVLADAARSPLVQRLAPSLAGDVADWASQQAARLDPATAATRGDSMGQAADVLAAAARALQQLYGKPLQIEVTSDTPELHARVVQRAERSARRGG